jgi:hypothetical protein
MTEIARIAMKRVVVLRPREEGPPAEDDGSIDVDFDDLDEARTSSPPS